MEDIDRHSQEETPFFSAIVKYIETNPTPFDVPGHKMGSFHTELSDYCSDIIYKMDINAPVGLDNLYHPSGVIKQSQDLCAQAFKADHCIFSVNGTTGGILSSLIGILKTNDKIVLPRNVHKSVINGLILTGAVPIFVTPDFDTDLGISNGVPFECYKKAIDENPGVKAIFIINPTYFGVSSDIQTIIDYAHERDIIVISDEAHGSHLYFSDKLPKAAIHCKADISSLSIHKTGGSLTQSSIILVNDGLININSIRKAHSMISSTSPNHLLMASLDVARKKLYFEGEHLIDEAIKLCDYARSKLQQIKGIKVIDKKYCNKEGRYDFDLTKLVIKVTNLGLSGFEVYKIMKEEFNIQLELAEVALVLCVVSLGSTKEHIDKLINAFKVLSERYYAKRKEKVVPNFKYKYPKLICTPTQAFDAPKKVVSLDDAIGEISGESLMIYPPGIPLAIPGEMITKDAIELIKYYKNQGGVLLSDTPDNKITVVDRSNWYLESEINYDY